MKKLIYILLFVPLALFGQTDPIYGCTYSTMFNYDSLAIVDDGSCIPYVYGCTDVTAYNFDQIANTDDGSCEYFDCTYVVCCGAPDPLNICPSPFNYEGSEWDCSNIYCLTGGCMDDSACNYDSSASQDDGSCTYIDGVCLICVDGIIVDLGIDTECPEIGGGCTDASACNYDATPTTDTDNDLCIYASDLDACASCSGETDGTGVIVDNDADDDTVCNWDEVEGCTEDWADNYDPEATEDNGSCVFNCEYYHCCGVYNNSLEELCGAFEGDCSYDCQDEVIGCIDVLACNYNSFATDDNGSCTYTNGICDTCVDGLIVDNDADMDGFCNADDVFPNDSSEWSDTDGDGYGDNSDVFPNDSFEWLDTDGDGYGDNSDAFPDDPSYWECGCCCIDCDYNGSCVDVDCDDQYCGPMSTAGCTQVWADNFDVNATTDDGSCYREGCMYAELANIVMYNYDSLATVDNNSCYPVVIGCTSSNACNFNPLTGDEDIDVNTDDGSCNIPDGICDSCEDGYVVDNDLDDDGYCDIGSGIAPEEILGCIYSLFFNYNPDATEDDGSCIPYVYGCTSDWADNYNEQANTDDGSCFKAGCMSDWADNYDTLVTIPGYTELPPAENPGNTGSNMTVMLLPGFVSGLNIQSETAYMIAFDGDLIVGYTDLSGGISQNSIAIWGDDSITPELDGATSGASISFKLIDGSSLYDVEFASPVSYTTGSISAQTSAPEVSMADADECYRFGCMSEWADNYDNLATEDDESCDRLGCMSDWADNFDELATTDDGSCDRLGCISDWADNYDELATTDDGSCERLGCTEDWADNYDDLATTDDGSCFKVGCIYEWADNYDPLATISSSQIPEPFSGNTGSNMTVMMLSSFIQSLPISDSDAYIVAIAESGMIVGSTSVDGTNQTSLAIWGDDTFTPEVDGAFVGEEITFQLVNGLELYDISPVFITGSSSYITSSITVVEGSSTSIDPGDCIRLGCMSDWADNYDDLATTDDGSCDRLGCISDWADNYDDLATTDDGSCDRLGCMSDWADNYDVLATTDDGSCYRIGCTQLWADNYDELATTDDGSCDRLGCMSTWADNYDDLATTDDGLCDRLGCMSDWADNYDVLATTDDGSCDRLGCMEDWADNYDDLATTDDGSCYRIGCVDELACNYDFLATQDGASCTYPGCIDLTFIEFYNQGYVAGCDDGSCLIGVQDLELIPENFQEPMLTGNSMTVGFDFNNINGIESGTIAAFYDLNGDGIINTEPFMASNGEYYWECVGSTEYNPNNFFTMGLWGDDSTTDEIDGLQDGQSDIIFALLTQDNQVIAFNLVPEFTSYTTNGILVANELDLNVTIYGCMNSNYCNYNPDAEEDDGTCEGIPGCMDELYMEYDATLGCNNQNMCLVTWEQAYLVADDSIGVLNNYIAEQNDYITGQDALLALQQEVIFSLENEILLLNNQIDSLYDYIAEQDTQLAYQQEYIYSLENEISILVTLINNLNNQLEECTEDLNYWSSPLEIDLLIGWNIIGYTFPEPQDVVATVVEIDDIIQIIKNNAAEVYWPEYGFNGIGDFIPGQGYQIKVTEAYLGFTYPDVSGQRIELVPTVPQWAIDMEAQIHPNDIRTLVRVVNMLGQEVNPENQASGTVLLYLYNDATVEKKIK
jgi:hypothetical protein